jgi:hypothetical protein
MPPQVGKAGSRTCLRLGSWVAVISFLSLGSVAAKTSAETILSPNEDRHQRLLDQQAPVYPDQAETEAAKLRRVISPGVATCSTVGMTTFCY